MNIFKFLSNNFLHLVIIALLVSIIVMNNQKNTLTKEGFMSDTVYNIIGVFVVFLVFCILVAFSVMAGGI